MAEAVGVRTVRSGSHLERMLASGIFAVTAEIAPPASADPTDIREIVSRYRGAVDACNVTDCTRARVRLSSLAAATIALREGIEPVMQMDPVSAGNEPEAKGVFDLKTEEMIETFRDLRDRGRLRGGDTVDAPPKVFIGAAADPFRGSKEESFAKLRAKVLAGADFVQTQAVYDIDAFEEWMRLVRKEWLHEKVYILAGVIPLRSAKMARFLVETLGATVPKHIMDRMEKAPDPKAEGVSIAVRTVKALRKIDGIRGVHLMPVGRDGVVARVVKEAGLLPRPEPSF